MEDRDRESAAHLRSLIEAGGVEPGAFRDALLRVAPMARDAWVDALLGLGELPDDGPDLPRSCVPYLPCPVDALLRMVDQAPVHSSDVFVDVGSGQGRAAAVVHLLTGASAIGLEIQHHLVAAARALATRLRVSRMSTLHGDATTLAGLVTTGSVFFLYCPFSGDRLTSFLAALEPVARTRRLRICCVDLPLPPRPWLTLDPVRAGDPMIYRTDLHAFGE